MITITNWSTNMFNWPDNGPNGIKSKQNSWSNWTHVGDGASNITKQSKTQTRLTDLKQRIFLIARILWYTVYRAVCSVIRYIQSSNQSLSLSIQEYCGVLFKARSAVQYAIIIIIIIIIIIYFININVT